MISFILFTKDNYLYNEGLSIALNGFVKNSIELKKVNLYNSDNDSIYEDDGMLITTSTFNYSILPPFYKLDNTLTIAKKI